MERSTFERFIDELRAAPPQATLPFTAPARHYTDPAHLARELATIFRAPRVVAASTDIAPGACLPIDLPGASALLVRDTHGTLRAFANACRHRGTRLVDAPCAAKALMCPYHGWTYGLDGALLHVPHADAFAGLGRRDLVERPVTERHGLVWLGAPPPELEADLAALGLDDHVVYKRARTTRRCNWKLVIEAFLDGYHIRVLHRASIYRFFLDAASVAEPAGAHIRAVTARRAIARPSSPDATATDLRQLGTPSFVVFPSTVIIAHPDFTSVITVYPLAPDVTDWDHMMLIPRGGDAEHWAKSWQLIEETVFQREDLWVCEQIQKSLATGATDELLFGTLEEPVRWFHAAIANAVGL